MTVPAFWDPRLVSAPKDFGIKFLNLECEFLRHDVFIVWLSPPHAETTLGGPHTGTGHPSSGVLFCPGPQGTVHSLRIQRTQGHHTAQVEPSGWGGQLCILTRARTTHSKTTTAAQLVTYPATEKPPPSRGQSQQTQ